MDSWMPHVLESPGRVTSVAASIEIDLVGRNCTMQMCGKRALQVLSLVAWS